MEVRPVVDDHAHALLQTNRDEYTELQINKLLENCLNRKVAEELLRQKCGVRLGRRGLELGNDARGRQSGRIRPAHCDTRD